jgi:hypothetical protein
MYRDEMVGETANDLITAPAGQPIAAVADTAAAVADPTAYHRVNGCCIQAGLPGFKSRSQSREQFLKALAKHSRWVSPRTLEREANLSHRAIVNQAHRLKAARLVGAKDGKYRLLQPRKSRALAPCRSRPMPVFADTGREHREVSRSALVKRGWPRQLIDSRFPDEGHNYSPSRGLAR